MILAQVDQVRKRTALTCNNTPCVPSDIVLVASHDSCFAFGVFFQDLVKRFMSLSLKDMKVDSAGQICTQAQLSVNLRSVLCFFLFVCLFFFCLLRADLAHHRL